jgi:hypothetical protein
LTLADPLLFRQTHRVYLWTSTVQWALGVAYTILMLVAWRAEDRGALGMTS